MRPLKRCSFPFITHLSVWPNSFCWESHDTRYFSCLVSFDHEFNSYFFRAKRIYFFFGGQKWSRCKRCNILPKKSRENEGNQNIIIFRKNIQSLDFAMQCTILPKKYRENLSCLTGNPFDFLSSPQVGRKNFVKLKKVK